MKRNKLLAEQVQKLLPQELLEQEAVIHFLNTVNDSYNEYDDKIESLQTVVPDSEQIQAAQDAAIQSDLKNRLVMDAALDAIITINNKSEITYWNPHAEKIFGWTSGEALGQSLTSTIIPPNHREAHKKGMERYLTSGKATVLNNVFEITAMHKSGREFPVEIFITSIQLKDEVFFCSFIRNISEKKQAEDQLIQTSMVASLNQNGVVFTAPDGKILWSNRGFSVLTGFTAGEIEGKTPVELLKGPLTDRHMLHTMINAFSHGENFDVQLFCYSKEKRTFWSRVTGQPVKNEEGGVVNYFAMVEDITAETEAKQKLKDYESRFRLALEKIGDNVWEHDFRTGNTYFSDTEGHLLGYDFDEFTNNARLWWNIVFPEDRWMLEENDRNYRAGQQSHHNIEYRMHHKNGSLRWILDRGVVIEKDAGGRAMRIIGTHTDITERKLPEQALRLKEEKYRSIIANINLGLIEVDIEERILFANQSFCGMSGYSFEELEGQKASAVFVRGQNQELMEAKSRLRSKGLSDAYEIVIRNKRGQLRWWLISGAPNYNDKGELVGSIGIHLDITEQKQLENDLIEARKQAEASARAKEVFLTNMSHEIRTPMNAILGMGRQLQRTSLDERQRFFMDTINNAAGNLLVVINDILDISKIEAGHLTIERIGFRLADVVNRTTWVMVQRAEEKRIHISCTIDPAIGPVLIGDPYRLNQVLLNLVGNAIKFTEKGTVQTECTLLSAENNRQYISIRVTDTGIGMEKEFLSRIFQAFLQEDKSIARKYGGSGLGMAISKQLVELMNGSIHIKSEKNRGTVIILKIPFEKGTPEDIPVKDDASYHATALAGKRILLVEDNEMNRLVVTTVLSGYGASITEAEHGAVAVALLKEQPFDLVLMDVQMPLMDGIEATAIIRQSVNPTIPIIALTANVVGGETDKCMAAGMNGYIAKPFEEEALIKMIVELLAQNNGIKNGSPGEEKLFDLSRLKEISRGNDAFVQKMLRLFCEQMPASITEMREAFTAGDIDKVKAIAHRMKPAIDNLSITLLKNKIRVIENSVEGDAGSTLLDQLITETATIIARAVERIDLL